MEVEVHKMEHLWSSHSSFNYTLDIMRPAMVTVLHHVHFGSMGCILSLDA